MKHLFIGPPDAFERRQHRLTLIGTILLAILVALLLLAGASSSMGYYRVI